MKIEWLFANVTAFGSPNRGERPILVVTLAGRFFDNSGYFFCWGHGRAAHTILTIPQTGACLVENHFVHVLKQDLGQKSGVLLICSKVIYRSK